jgi:hypothetical protein
MNDNFILNSNTSYSSSNNNEETKEDTNLAPSSSHHLADEEEDKTSNDSRPSKRPHVIQESPARPTIHRPREPGFNSVSLVSQPTTEAYIPPIPLHGNELHNFQFEPCEVYSSTGTGKNVWLFQRVREIRANVKAERYGNRVSGVFTGDKIVEGVLLEGVENEDDFGLGFDVAAFVPRAGEFKDWFKGMFAEALASIAIYGFPLLSDTYHEVNDRIEATKNSFSCIGSLLFSRWASKFRQQTGTKVG